MAFPALTAVLASYHQARHRFVRVEVASLVAMACALIFLLQAMPRFGVAAAAWSLVLRAVLECALLIPGIGRYSRLDLGSACLVEARRRVRPLLLGAAFYRTEPMMDRLLASFAPPGSLSLLALGRQILDAVCRVMTKAVVTPMIPELARRVQGNDLVEFRRTYLLRLFIVSIIAALGFVLLLTFGQPVLGFLFARKNLTHANVHLLWWIMLCLTGVLVGNCAREILASSCYAMGETVTPTLVGTLSYVVSLALKICGFFAWGVVGVAISASVSYLFTVLLLQLVLSHHLRQRQAGRICAAGAE
jgi:putative peptidoglycan lipid II flippase